MTEWYSFTPQDTLFFRGADPANMGENHTASMIFPPPVHTIAGALRTATLIQKGVSFNNYNKGECDSDIIEAIGRSGGASPFEILGPFFLENEKIWIPCPFIWFAEKKEETESRDGVRTIIVSSPFKSSLIKTASGERFFWARGVNLETLGGKWVCLDDFYNSANEKTIKDNRAFFNNEVHTGIALDVKNTRRKTRAGHLYSFIHARLCEGVKMVFGVTRELPLDDSGILKLGAEQRFGEYQKIDEIKLPKLKSELYMTLSVIAGSEEANNCCIATGRINYFGGWDLHRGFHKPMKGYFPAGTVFTKKINDQCIPIQEGAHV